MRKADFHESLERDDEVEGPTDRSFGLTVGGALIGLAALGFVIAGASIVKLAMVAIGAALVAGGLIAPSLLAPLNRLWMKFAAVLHSVMTPLILGLVFVLAIVPIGLLMRALGKDPMRLKRDAGADTYWITRDPPGPAAKSMSEQF